MMMDDVEMLSLLCLIRCFLLVAFDGSEKSLCLRVGLEVAPHRLDQFVDHL